MKHATAATLDQSARNQMSIMAWIMAALCAWILFLSAYAGTMCAPAAMQRAAQSLPDCNAAIIISNR